MKDLIEKILKYLPQYFLDLGRVFSGPKRFIAAKNVDSDEAFGDACLFFGISMVLLFIFGTARLKLDSGVWSSVGSEFSQIIVAVILAGGAMCASWWIVGGRASGKSIFLTYMYFCATATSVGILMDTLGEGLLKVSNRSLYDQFIAFYKSGEPRVDISEKIPGFTESMAVNASIGVLLVGYLVGLIWFIIAWGAFRQLNKVGKFRSIIAFVLWILFAIPLVLAVNFIDAVLAPD